MALDCWALDVRSLRELVVMPPFVEYHNDLDCVTEDGTHPRALARFILLVPWYNRWRGEYDRLPRPICEAHRPKDAAFGDQLGNIKLIRYVEREPMCSADIVCPYFLSADQGWRAIPGRKDRSVPHESHTA